MNRSTLVRTLGTVMRVPAPMHSAWMTHEAFSICGKGRDEWSSLRT